MGELSNSPSPTKAPNEWKQIDQFWWWWGVLGALPRDSVLSTIAFRPASYMADFLLFLFIELT